MNTRRSSLGVLLWSQAFFLFTILAVVGIAFAARATVASSTATGPATAVDHAAALAAETPVLVEVDGVVVATGNGLLGVHETGAAAPVAFRVGDGTGVTRDGAAVSVDNLRLGDAVRMMVDGRTGQAVRIAAEPGATVAGESRSPFPVLAALLLIVSAAVLFARRSQTWPTAGGRGRRPLVAPLARPLALRPRV